MMEKYLPNTKFTYSVVFFDDFLYILTNSSMDFGMHQGMIRQSEYLYEEKLQINKIEIASSFDYQPDQFEIEKQKS